MYFWRINQLKADLRQGDLKDRQAFGYFLCHMVLTAFFSNPEFAPADIDATWNWLATSVALLAVVIGTTAAYRANGGAAGRSFLPRYFALSWVLGIRLLAVLFVPLVLLYAVLAPDPEGRGGAPGLANLLCVLIVSSVFYWRIAVHFRSVAATERVATTGIGGQSPRAPVV